MAKNNNKGFSIAELIVAIAIMTLLLTPILRSLTATLATNRRTKEQQYAVENAEYVLQYVQTSSLAELGDTTSTDQDIYCVSSVIKDGSSGNAKHSCLVYVLADDGTVGASAEQTIDYSTYEYQLNDVKLGSKKTEYTRKVVLDDIANRIKNLEYVSLTDADGDGKNDVFRYEVAYNNDAAAEGFKLTTEGSMVQYDADGYVSAIVCRKTSGNKSIDPNNLNMGNMHNFDYKQMALINGYATDYDKQAGKDFYAETMEILKNSDKQTDKDRWLNALSGTVPLDSKLYTLNMRKLTEIKISENTTDDYYEVSVSVVYENTIEGKFIQKKYDNIFAQRFEYKNDATKVPPEVYIEYQPFSTQSNKSDDSLDYAENEYVIIDNSVKDVKIYFVKPNWDQAKMFVNGIDKASDIPNDNSTATDVYYCINEPDSITRTNFTKTNINIASANKITADNKFTIYTNLNLTDSVVGNKTDGTAVTCDKPQFTLNSQAVYSTPIFKVGTNNRTSFEVPVEFLQKIEDEDTKGNRLYTATITLVPKNEDFNTIIFTGAKGGN